MKETEAVGSDLELMVAMLEKSEIDYNEDEDNGQDEVFVILDVNETVRMVFDEAGSLIEVNPIPN